MGQSDECGPTGAVAEVYLNHNQHFELLQAYDDLDSVPYTILRRLDFEEIARQPTALNKLQKVGLLHPEFQTPIIEAWIALGCLTEAKSTIKAFKHELEQYPPVLFDAYCSAFTYWTHVMKMDIKGLIRLCATDQQAALNLLLWYQQWDTPEVAAIFHVLLDEDNRQSLLRAHPREVQRIASKAVGFAYWKADYVSWQDKPCDLDLAGQTGPHGLPGAMLTLAKTGIDLQNIIIVNEMEGFREGMKIISTAMASQALAGLDAEWRTGLIATRTPPASLLQVAVRPAGEEPSAIKVFVIDLYCLTVPYATPEDSAEVLQALSDYLSSTGGVKIGVSFDGDMHQLRARAQSHLQQCGGSLEATKWFQKTEVIEFKHVVRAKLLHESPDSHECAARVAEWGTAHKRSTKRPHEWAGGLAEAVYILSGMHISKDIQCSNWELRPLGNQQIAYAALDAGVLFHLSEKVVQETQADVKILVERVKAHAARVGPGDKPSRAPKMTLKEYAAKFRCETEELREQWRRCRVNNHVEEWRFLVATDEVRLSQILRGLGYDTERSQQVGVTLRRSYTFAEQSVKGLGRLVSEANQKDRVLLLNISRKSGAPGSHNNCEKARLQYIFRSSDLTDRVKEVVAVFDLQFDKSRLCERCPACNCADWIPGEEADNKLPESVREVYSEFRQCKDCKKLYWEGVMWRNARERFAIYFDNQFSFELKAAELDRKMAEDAAAAKDVSEQNEDSKPAERA